MINRVCDWFVRWHQWIYAVLLPLLLPRVVGLWLILLGALLNAFVMWRNGGRMPVATALQICDLNHNHTVIHPFTKHKWLCDIWHIPLRPKVTRAGIVFRARGTASLGDLIIWTGGVLFYAQVAARVVWAIRGGPS